MLRKKLFCKIYINGHVDTIELFVYNFVYISCQVHDVHRLSLPVKLSKVFVTSGYLLWRSREEVYKGSPLYN